MTAKLAQNSRGGIVRRTRSLLAPPRARHGFTLFELLVVMALVVVLAAILFPVLARVREMGRRAVCVSNIKQIGGAVTMYSQDWDGILPPGALVYPAFAGGDPGEWYLVIQPYARNRDILRCPTKPSADIIAYGWNYRNFGYYYGQHGLGWCTVKGHVAEPAGTILLGDNEDLEARDVANVRYLYSDLQSRRLRAARHSGGGVYWYLDGHATRHQRDWLDGHLGLFTQQRGD